MRLENGDGIKGNCTPGVFNVLKITTPGEAVEGKSVVTFPVKLTLSSRR